MIETAFTLFIENLGGRDFIIGIMGIVLAFVIVISLIDYILE